MPTSRRLLPLLTAGLMALPIPAAAEKTANAVAVFTGLDKITGRIITFDVYIDETVQFGALRVTPRVCYNRPPTEAAQTDAFVEVDEITLENEIQRIFTGWMFAASPGLNAVEHPVYDVWLNDCRQTSDVAPPGERTGDEARTAAANPEPSAAASDGEAYGVQMVDGIPVPRPKPLIAATPSLALPDPATTGDDAPPTEILD